MMKNLKKLGFTLIFGIALSSFSSLAYAATGPGSRPAPRPAPIQSVQARGADLATMKTKLQTMIAQLQTHLQEARSKITNLVQDGTGTKTELLKNIDARLQALTILKSGIVAAQDHENLKKIGDQIHDLIEGVKHDVKISMGKRLGNSIENFGKKGDEFLISAKGNVEKLEKERADMGSIEQTLRECENLIQKGKTELDQAKAKLQQMQKGPGNRQEVAKLMKEGVNSMQISREKFKTAQQQCKKLMDVLKASKLRS